MSGNFKKWTIFEILCNQSSKGISETVAEFIANFLIRIVTKRGQKLILEYNFKNKNSDDFYVIQL